MKSLQQAHKRLAQYAYNYTTKQHQMINLFRSQKDIERQRQMYLKRNPKIQVKQKQKFDNQKIVQKQEKTSGIKRTESFTNLHNKQQAVPQMQVPKFQQQNSNKKSETKPFNLILNPNPKQFVTVPELDSGNLNGNLFNNLNNGLNNENNNNGYESFSDFVEKALYGDQRKQEDRKNIFSFGQSNSSNKVISPFPKNQQKKNEQTQNSKIKTNQIKENGVTQKIVNTTTANKQQKIQVIQKPQVQQGSKQNRDKTQAQKQKQKQIQKQKQKTVEKVGIKVTSSEAYLNGILKYSQRIKAKTQISTKIGNLNGSKSDPREFWEFTSSYIKTINPDRSQEVETFTFLVWEAIIHKFIKNANARQGFQPIAPKLKSQQVQKNSINTYILYINTFRAMGFQSIWLGVFGKTLQFLQFLIKRKEPITEWRKLELIQSKYIQPCENISARYQSKLDFLTYFLLGLTTFDPIEVFTQISQKTGQPYPFIDELRKYKYKWSYRQFWCLIDMVKNNKLQAYFKIPFWNNVLSAIYPQLLAYSKTKDQMKQFSVLSKWIFKQVKELTKKISNTVEGKRLGEQDEQNKPNGGYGFDGQQFIAGIKTLGRMVTTKEKEMGTHSWQQFRDKFSVFYYFWRIHGA